MVCSITLLWSEGNSSSPVRYSYLLILPDDNVDIFAASLLISSYNFSSLILSSIVVISFYIPSERSIPKRKGLCNAIVVLTTKKEYGFAVHFM